MGVSEAQDSAAVAQLDQAEKLEKPILWDQHVLAFVYLSRFA
jgi:hypothetical protein